MRILEESINALADSVREKTGQLTDANEELRKSAQRYRLLFESATDGILMTDIETQAPRYANPAFCDLLGYTEEELRNKTAADIFPKDEQDRMRREFEAMGRGEIKGVSNIPCVRKDGSLIFADISSSAVEADGRMTLIGFFRDVTERRKTEEEILKLRKIESVGLLAGGIAHDFNNSLAAILGGVDHALLEIRDDPKEAEESLELAKRAVFSARDLTRQLLTFSKGGAPILKSASLANLLPDTCGFVLRGSSSRADYAIQPGLWPAKMDPGQISQVVQNLVINADQAMQSGGAIRISAENFVSEGNSTGSHMPAGKYVKVSVSDNGDGISPENLSKIFDPYFTTKKKGHGLGLSMAFSIISKHHGRIVADSIVGKGTTFTFWLPASEEMAEKAAVVQRPTRPKGNIRVLALDDNDFIREILGKALRRHGYDITTVDDGAEAVRIYAESLKAGKPIDVVLLDLTLPGGMGGVQTLEEMKKINPDVKAVVASGYAADPVMADHKAYGFAGMVVKPYNYEDLFRVIEEITG